MAGIAFGSILMAKRIEKIRKTFASFFLLELCIIVFTLLTALLLTNFNYFEKYGSLIFFALFFISGVFPGMEFVLAGKIYLKERKDVGETAGLLYCADLLGSWLAGILGGIVFLPVLGLFNTCMAVIILKLCNLALLIVARKGLTKAII
jgi:predicted membrane-bound spermidine synthase